MPDFYEFLGLPRRLALDTKELETRFYALSRKLHPDLFARKSAAEQAKALDDSALLNDAYRTLRDPIARVQYVLKAEGFDVTEQSTKDVPAELLEEVFELNMALEELRMGDEDAREQLEESKARFTEMLGEIDAEVGAKSAEWDASGDREVLAAIRALLNRRKYVTNLIEKAHVPDRV
jgi:molecular chaperone HscB